MNAEKLVGMIRQYPVISGGLLLCAILIGINVWYSGALENRRQRVSEIENELRVIDRNREFSIGLKADVEELRKLDAAIDERLIQRSDKVSNLSLFYRLERGTSVRVTSVSQTEPAQSSGRGAEKREFQHFDPVGFSLTVEGRFREVLGYLESLLYGSQFVRINDFSISPGKSELTATVELRLQLEILGRKES